MGRVISDLPSFSETVANGDLLVCHNVSKAVNTRDEKLTVEKLMTDALLTTSNTFTGTNTFVSNNSGATPFVVNLTGTASLIAEFQDSGSNVMAIRNGGNVGIGTNSPGNRLSIEGALNKNTAAGTGWGINVNDTQSATTGVGGGIVFQGFKTAQTAGANFAAIAGIKQNSTAGNEEGALLLYTNPGGAGVLTERLRIAANGDVTVVDLSGVGTSAIEATSAGLLQRASSDARMKTDVEEIGAGNALGLVDALRPVRYRWNEEYAPMRGEQVEVGLIAQEVQAHVPELVGANRDGMLSVDYARLTALLIGAVQALTARVAALEAAAAA